MTAAKNIGKNIGQTSIGQTSIGGAAELMLMMLADARLPTGAHTQSAGLEPAVRAGMPVSHVPDYLRARIRTVTAVEAGTAVVARHLALTTPAERLPALLKQLRQAWRARTISEPMRDASDLVGRGYLRLMAALWPASPVSAALAELRPACRPIVLGGLAAVTGLSAGQLVRLIGLDDAQTVAAAALKLEPMDPMQTTAWVLATHPAIEELVQQLGQLQRIDDIPALAAPQLEEWANAHHTATRRLFRA